MILYFNDNYDNMRSICYIDDQLDEVNKRVKIFEEINEFCKRHKYDIPYMRFWNSTYNDKEMTQVDVGSHSEFFFIYPTIEINEEV